MKKIETKQFIISKANPVMVEQLLNFESYIVNSYENVREILKDVPDNEREDILKEFKDELLKNNGEDILMGGRFNQYVLTYDEINHNIEVKDVLNDEVSFGVNVENAHPDYFDYLDISCCINDRIEEYFGDRIIEDCGEYWEIKEVEA